MAFRCVRTAFEPAPETDHWACDEVSRMPRLSDRRLSDRRPGPHMPMRGGKQSLESEKPLMRSPGWGTRPYAACRNCHNFASRSTFECASDCSRLVS